MTIFKRTWNTWMTWANLASYCLIFPSIWPRRRIFWCNFAFAHCSSTSWIPSKSLETSQYTKTTTKIGNRTYVTRDSKTLRRLDGRSFSLMLLTWYHSPTSTRIVPTSASFCITTPHSPFNCLTSCIRICEDTKWTGKGRETYVAHLECVENKACDRRNVGNLVGQIA